MLAIKPRITYMLNMRSATEPPPQPTQLPDSLSENSCDSQASTITVWHWAISISKDTTHQLPLGCAPTISTLARRPREINTPHHITLGEGEIYTLNYRLTPLQ